MRTEQDSDVEKRLLLAIVLSMAILFGTPYVYQKLNLTPPPAEPAISDSEGTAPVKREVEAEVVPEPAEKAPKESQEPTIAAPKEVVLDTEDLHLVFTNVGAYLTSVQLKQYKSSEGEWLEIVPQNTSAESAGVLALRSLEEGLNRLLNEASYEVGGPNQIFGEGFTEIVFTFRGKGIEATKRILVPDKGYQLRVAIELSRDGAALPCLVQVGPGMGNLGEASSTDFLDPAVVFLQNDSVERYYVDDFETGEETPGSFRWAGLDSKYFAFVLIYPPGIRGLWKEKKEALPGPDEEDADGETPLLNTVADLGEAGEFSIFLGPKSSEELSAADPTLSQLIDFGEWLGVLVKPLLVALKFIQGYIRNWGWSIITLTFLINLALFPFRYKQMASMAKMSAVQPKLKSIQDKYKRMKRDDPRKQQMNAEVMALYKEHGVNPLGGCLPLLLQMPILFAFYRMLYTSIELRGAPFMLWIQDLSKPDPYYVTPIVMGATMVAQQKMTPATGDPAQRRMMMFLPILFTFFFLQVSSGLAIYFLFSNVFGMALQFLLQKFKPELTAKGRKTAGNKKQKKEKK